MYQAAVLNKSKVNPYLADQILNATPEQLLLKAYDYAVVHSEKKDMIKTNRAIQVLTGFLRFDDESYSELSQRLLRLYQFCEEQTRK
ncbi:MAG: flagellar protein FliS, partial [Ignavibacteriales bacterium]|nr:flagellar protein FliS [Ignavibacteriales bacterium]